MGAVDSRHVSLRESMTAKTDDINRLVHNRKLSEPGLYLHLNPVRANMCFKVLESSFIQTRKHGNEARSAAIYLVRRLTTQSVAAIAEQFGGVSLSAISISVKRSELRRSEDAAWNHLLAKLEKRCRKNNSKT